MLQLASHGRLSGWKMHFQLSQMRSVISFLLGLFQCWVHCFFCLFSFPCCIPNIGSYILLDPWGRVFKKCSHCFLNLLKFVLFFNFLSKALINTYFLLQIIFFKYLCHIDSEKKISFRLFSLSLSLLSQEESWVYFITLITHKLKTAASWEEQYR